MAEIPEISFTEFSKLKAKQLRVMKSVIVTSDGERLFTAIIAPQNTGMTIIDTINTKAEYLGASGNSVGGLHPDIVLGKVLV